MFKRFFYDYNNTIVIAKDELKESFKTQFSKMKGGTDSKEATGTAVTVATPTATIQSEVDTSLLKLQKKYQVHKILKLNLNLTLH